MRVYVPMNNVVFVEIMQCADHLPSYLCLLLSFELSFSFMDQIVERTFLDVLQHYAKIRRNRAKTDQKNDIGMSHFGKHIDLIAEFFQKFLCYFGIESFLDGYLKSSIRPPMDCTKSTH